MERSGRKTSHYWSVDECFISKLMPLITLYWKHKMIEIPKH